MIFPFYPAFVRPHLNYCLLLLGFQQHWVLILLFYSELKVGSKRHNRPLTSSESEVARVTEYHLPAQGRVNHRDSFSEICFCDPEMFPGNSHGLLLGVLGVCTWCTMVKKAPVASLAASRELHPLGKSTAQKPFIGRSRAKSLQNYVPLLSC